jgi:hypothetical protein
MKPTQPKRAALPVRPRPGLEVVFKKIAHIPQGGIICTVSYLESKRTVIAPAPKKTLLMQFSGVLSRLRSALRARLGGLRARIGV